MGTADTSNWAEPRDLTVLGAHPTYWLALVMTVCLTVAVSL